MTIAIPQKHPRVLVNETTLSRARRRAETTHRREFESLAALARQSCQQPASEADLPNVTWRLSFLYLLSQERGHAQVALEHVQRMMALPVDGEYRTGVARIKQLACAYDWLHDVMNDDLRQRLAVKTLEHCQKVYETGEVDPNNTFLGHNANQTPYIAMAGIGIARELAHSDTLAPVTAANHPWFPDPSDPPAIRFLHDVLRRSNEALRCYNRFLEQSCFQQSYAYTGTYLGEFSYLFETIESGLGIPMYGPNACMRNIVEWWTQAFRSDETFHRFGDYFCAMAVLENGQYFRPMATIADKVP